ncbi:diguanylate cyclase domain-containing protein [Nitrincola tibetensis]|uniref:diguanylate cyclase domain-containing protein n=1 Tax=Nitrincola tibetensis TaxID=2219697 RepID=UPI0013901A3C|nr:diguanylate cyclase [Nitrincola tibetensis]
MSQSFMFYAIITIVGGLILLHFYKSLQTRTAMERESETTVLHHCSASIGVPLFIDHQASQEDILKLAGLAMYQAKKEGRNIIRYFENSDKRSQ